MKESRGWPGDASDGVNVCMQFTLKITVDKLLIAKQNPPNAIIRAICQIFFPAKFPAIQHVVK